MINILSILSLGFFLGMRHATDADHVVAVTTIVSRERSLRKAMAIGAFWGIGHTLTLFVAGGAIIALGLVVPQKLGESLEFIVALMLIFLGFWNVRGMAKEIRNGKSAQHSHAILRDPLSGSARFLRPMGIGVVHGLAGSAVIALLVLPLVRDPAVAAAYLLIFGLGTIAGMVLITTMIAAPFSFVAQRSEHNGRYIAWASSALSIGFGLLLVYQIGIAGGLLLP